MGASRAGSPGPDDGGPASRLVGVGRARVAGSRLATVAVAGLGWSCRRAACRGIRLPELGRCRCPGRSVRAGRRSDLGLADAGVTTRCRAGTVMGSARGAARASARARTRGRRVGRAVRASARVGGAARVGPFVEPALGGQLGAGRALRAIVEPTGPAGVGPGYGGVRCARAGAGSPERGLGRPRRRAPSRSAAHGRSVLGGARRSAGGSARRSGLGRPGRSAGLGHPQDRRAGGSACTFVGSACCAGCSAVPGARASAGRAGPAPVERPGGACVGRPADCVDRRRLGGRRARCDAGASAPRAASASRTGASSLDARRGRDHGRAAADGNGRDRPRADHVDAGLVPAAPRAPSACAISDGPADPASAGGRSRGRATG